MLNPASQAHHRKWGILLIASGVMLVCFSVIINVIDNQHPLASGTAQFVEFALGSLLIYVGAMMAWLKSLSWRELLSRITLPIVSFFLSLTLLEIALQWLLPPPAFDSRLPLYPNIRRQIRIDLTYVAPIIHYSTNQIGLRGDNPPMDWDSTQTILTVGGSTTHSGVIDDELTWSALLQDNLAQDFVPVWVGNSGIDGHSTYGNLLVMDSVVRELRPDLVIILVGINDLGIALSDSSGYGTYDDFRNAPILFRSHLFRFAWQVLHLVTGNVVTTHSTQKAFVPEPLPTDASDGIPDVSADLAQYRENLLQLVELANELDVQLLFLTQPILFEESSYWDGIRGYTVWIQDQSTEISASTYANLMRQYNAVLLEVCDERRVPCFDLASRIPNSDRYFYDFIHFNENGSRLVADELTPVVSELLQTQEDTN